MGGLLYRSQDDDSLRRVIEQWDHLEAQVRPAMLQAHARQFSEAQFAQKMGAVLKCDERRFAEAAR
jgi:hypothetical protein